MLPTIIRKHLSLALVFGALVVLAACAGPAGRVSVLQSDTVGIRPGSTFAWKPDATPGQGDPRVDNDIIRGRVENAIVSALTARGYRQADPSTADLLVSYHIGLRDRTDTQVATTGGRPPVVCGVRGCFHGFGWGMYGPPMDIDVRTINYVEGTMMLDLTDRQTGKLAWRSTSQRRVDQGDAAQATVNAIVADMVRSLP
ncbi:MULTISPECIES: DUF4136 domain-containing protein [Phenylobacterium]|uniref:DUF4136 domain-containing protein n=1 Tax=Phenylobacterium koreense TaxID=266125 RepID=A0ABV2EKE3_9CAUL